MTKRRKAFLEGLAATLDIAGASRLRSHVRSRDAATALKGDWERIGRDMTTAIVRYRSSLGVK